MSSPSLKTNLTGGFAAHVLWSRVPELWIVSLLDHAMISKRQKWILWSSFALLVLFSTAGFYFSWSMRAVVPMLLNDSSPNFGQLADEDRWRVYHAAQSVIGPIALVMLALAVLWTLLAGFSIWRLSKKSEHETH
jgi:hypothetical protein